ncbi:MAG TPA: serine hydrolase domain-containing protein [Bryobacteraceae bacterium]|nr:serine hydrolase domain-containing protein [Bryobacteraceae bacterium]
MRIFLSLILLGAALAQAQPLPLAAPEAVGLSPERLVRLHRTFEQLTTEGKRAGAVTMIVRDGKIADWHAYGYRDLGAKLPMEKDSIFHIWSMTKSVTSVAAMVLIEEGKLALEDKVETYIPEFKDVQVFRGGTAGEPVLGKPSRPMTIKHLLTHTSGLQYGWEEGPIPEFYKRAKVFEAGTLKEFAGKAAHLPLAFDPGDQYQYGISIDVLGYVVEVVSGMPFDRFVKTRILEPLKMRDTWFVVPPDQRGRLARTYTTKDGKLVEQAREKFEDTAVPFGGMGLYSTIGDYARFAQALLNGGQLDGVRILSRKTVELMMANHLNHMARPTTGGSDAEGFGLGGSVRIDLAKGNSLGSVGEFGWGGAASTYYRIDPKERSVVLLFMQYMPYDSATLARFSTLFYQAIAD